MSQFCPNTKCHTLIDKPLVENYSSTDSDNCLLQWYLTMIQNY